MKELIPLFTVVGFAISVLNLLITVFGPLAGVSVATFVIGVLVGYLIAKRRLHVP